MEEIKAKSDEQILKEFIEGTPYWYNALLEEVKERDHCVMCGIPPSELKKLAEILSKYKLY